MIAIIGCGNLNRKDDAVGPAVIRLLKETAIDDQAVKLLDAGTDGMAVMFAARGCERLIIVDACLSGSEPGAVFEVPGERLQKPRAQGINLHDFRWENALHAGQQIYKENFPEDVAVFLIEAKETGYGIGMSPEVETSARLVAEKILTRIDEWTAKGTNAV